MINKFKIDITDQDNYTLPEIKKQGTRWFIEFYYNRKRHRYTYDLNRIKDLKKREKMAILLRNALENKLINGFNPDEINEPEYAKEHTFESAFDFGYEKVIKSIRPNTLKSYKNYIKNIKESDHFDLIKNIPIKEIKRKDIIELFESIEESNVTTTKMINKAIVVLKVIFNKLIEYDIIEHSVLDKIKIRKTEKPKIRIPSNKEVFKIKHHLEESFPNLWGFVCFIFQSGARPSEILSIKLNMIDFQNRTITIPKEFVKTKIERVIAIDNPIYLYLEKVNVKDKDKNLYLFAKTKKQRDLCIGEIKANIYQVDHLWKALIKDEILIDVNLYSFKHLRANKELALNNNLEQAKVLFGHSDLKTTEIYANQKNEIFIEKLKQNTLDLNNLK